MEIEHELFVVSGAGCRNTSLPQGNLRVASTEAGFRIDVLNFRR